MTEPKHPQCEFDFEQGQEPRRVSPSFAGRVQLLAEMSEQGLLQNKPEDQLRYNTGKPRMHYILAAPSAQHVMSSLDCYEYSKDLYGLMQAACAFMTGGSADEFVRDVCDAAAIITGKCGAELYQDVAEYGAEKYTRGNFLKGANICQYLDSWLRHFKALCDGISTDAESGKLHLAHIVWNTIEAARWVGHATRDDRLVSPK